MPNKSAGAHREKQLSDARVRNETRPGRHMDGNGLFLFVAKTGSKRWGQRLMINRVRHDISLGSYPSTSLKDARLAASHNKELARKGIDPLVAKKQAEKDAELARITEDGIPTFSEMAHRVCSKKETELSNKKAAAQWRSTLERYAFPIIGDMKVSDVSVQDVLKTLNPIWDSVPETANRLRGRIENVLDSASVLGHRTGDNPARWRGNLEVILPSHAKMGAISRQPTMDLRAVPHWWARLADRDGMAARALAFTMLTGARSGEIRGAAWSEISLKRQLWTIPSERMKNKVEHIVPLSDAAINILDSIPKLENSDLIFFAPRGGQLSDMSLSAVMRRIQKAEVARLEVTDRKAGLHPSAGSRGFVDPKSGRPAVPHGLRTCLRTWISEVGYPYELGELALSHKVGSVVSQAYNRAERLEARRRMMQHWADYLAGEVGLFSDYDGNAKVVQLRS